MRFLKYKKRASLSILMMCLIVFSCDPDLLDEDVNPNTLTPSTFWQKESDAINAIVGAYSPYTDIWYYTRGEIFLSDYRDDVTNPFAVSDRSNPGRFAGTSDQNFIEWVWRAQWFAVTRANEIIANVPGIEMDEGLRNNIIGEAHFIRAHNYFNLLNNWLNIPLVTDPATSVDYSAVVQADPSEVKAQIVSDLMMAKSLLPDQWDSDNTGRATSGAATAMLGKAYLYDEEWSLAVSEFQEVMSSGMYNLVNNYADNFSAFTENNSESIFEIQFIADNDRRWGGDAPGRGRTNSFTPDIAPQGFTGQDGMRINQWVLDLFLDERTVNGEIDPRAFNTIFWRTDETTIYRGDTLASTIYSDMPYDSAFTDLTENRVWGKKYLGLDEGVTTALFQRSPNNLRLIRYADVLLMYAEAQMMANGGNVTQEAVNAVNEVRARVDMPLFDLNMTMDDLRDERVKELSLERTRYFDLLRWGMVLDRIVNNPDDVKSESGGTGAYQPGREYLDLPQNDLNVNPNFSHNPGY